MPKKIAYMLPCNIDSGQWKCPYCNHHNTSKYFTDVQDYLFCYNCGKYPLLIISDKVRQLTEKLMRIIEEEMKDAD